MARQSMDPEQTAASPESNGEAERPGSAAAGDEMPPLESEQAGEAPAAEATVTERVNALGARGLERLGSALERAGDSLGEREGTPGQAAASPLRGAGHYLQKSTPTSMVSDLDRSIARHPYRSMAVGAGFGWVVGRLLRRTRSR